jgi:hypothetical protein
MKTTMNLIKITSIFLLTLCINSFGQENSENTITGSLKYLKSSNNEVFIAIDSTKRIATKGDDGSLVSSKTIQLAIPDPELGRKAMELIGKKVISQGKPMAAHTQHHHTEVLWIVTSIEESLDTNDNPAQNQQEEIVEENQTSETLNPHSVEW